MRKLKVVCRKVLFTSFVSLSTSRITTVKALLPVYGPELLFKMIQHSNRRFSKNIISNRSEEKHGDVKLLLNTLKFVF